MDNQIFNLKSPASLGIVLDLFKNEHITQNEAIQLIEDLYKGNSPSYYPLHGIKKKNGKDLLK